MSNNVILAIFVLIMGMLVSLTSLVCAHKNNQSDTTNGNGGCFIVMAFLMFFGTLFLMFFGTLFVVMKLVL